MDQFKWTIDKQNAQAKLFYIFTLLMQKQWTLPHQMESPVENLSWTKQWQFLQINKQINYKNVKTVSSNSS